MIRLIHTPLLLLALCATFQLHAGMMGYPTLDQYAERAHQYGVKLTIPDFPESVEAIEASEAELLKMLDTIGDQIAALEVSDLSFDNTFGALDWGSMEITNRILPIRIVNNTHANPEIRDAASKVIQRFSEAQIAFNYREDVYLNLKAFADSNPSLDDQEQRLVDDMLLEYERLGFDLPIEERARVEALNKELSALSIAFGDHIREANEVLVFTKEELAGLSDSFLESIRNVEGEYEILPNVTHHVLTVFNRADSEATRKRVFEARNRRAMESNLELLSKMVNVRASLAKALGYETWADYRTEVRMAQNGDRALHFLEDLAEQLEPKFQQELQSLRERKITHTNNPDAELNVWDVRYYQQQQQQEEYAVDSESLRAYFPFERAVQGMFQIYENVFGIVIDEIENPTPWDPSVPLYIISDAATEKPLGLFYMDSFPREGKFNHFAKFNIIRAGTLPDGTYQRPTVALICNFPPPGENEPALLSFEDVETLFHEFGHCLHSILTESRFAHFSGTSVPLDFVEVPSQVLEFWLEDPEVLNLFAAHWQDLSQKLPEGIVERINASRKAEAGWFYRRQLAFGILDLTLHHQTDPEAVTQDIAGVTNRIVERIYMPFPEQTALVASFGHLAGYDAGYYGYAWADVIAADIANQFATAPGGFLDAEMGMRLRREIFEPGNSRDVNVSAERFLGRKPNNAAFVRSLGLDDDEGH